jgi:hypothetical protein
MYVMTAVEWLTHCCVIEMSGVWVLVLRSAITPQRKRTKKINCVVLLVAIDIRGLYFSTDVSWIIKLRRGSWTEHVACMGELTDNVLVNRVLKLPP